MQKFTKSTWIYLIPIIIFLAFSVWWLYLRSLSIDSSVNARQLWGATYQVLALYGGIVGVFISKKWGGYKSLIGKVVLAFSIGLFLQSFGQTYSSYYVFVNHVDSPAYPAIGDIGFFGSVIAYIYGVVLLSKLSGLGVSLRKIQNKVLAVLIPIVILVLSYHFFLNGHEFDWSNKIKIFLDFGYPFGQALYVSIAVIALILSKNVLGGIMKKPILLLIFALLFQYFSDFTFLYQANLGNWYVANINDYLYCVSYFIMTISLIKIGLVFEHIKNK